MIVYVVIHGERGEGGCVVGVRTRLDEAEIIALSQSFYHPDGWQLEEEDDDPRNDGDTVKRWECASDFVEIERWEVRNAVDMTDSIAVPIKDQSGLQSWPESWPWYKQTCFRNWDSRCDMLVGPCRCGAWHQPGEFRWESPTLYRYDKPVQSLFDPTRPRPT